MHRIIEAIVMRFNRISYPLFLGFLLLVLSLIPCSRSKAEKLTLDKCIELADEQNIDIRIAKENVARAAFDIDEASAEGLPKLSADWAITRSDEAVQPNIDGQSMLVNPLYARAGHFVFGLPLDVFGIIKLGNRLAHLGKVQAQYDYEKACNNLIFDVKKGFYDVLRAEENVRISKESLSDLEAHLADARANLKAGTIAKFEVLRAETEAANSRVACISAENALRLSCASFNNLLGRDLNAPLDLEPPSETRYFQIDLKSCIQSATSARPEVRNADTQVELTDKMITIAKRTGQPRINLLWKFNRNYDPTFIDSRSASWNANVSAGVSLLDGGATRSQINQARSDAISAKSGKTAVTLGVGVETHQAYLNIRQAKEAVTSADKGLALAKESARLADSRYKNGLSTQVELLDARAALTQAESYYATALYDYRVAVAKLEQSVGGPREMAKLLNSVPSTNDDKVASNTDNQQTSTIN